MKEIDARGLSCPQPVLLVKKAVEGENPESLVVLLTGETSKGNVTRFAESRGYRVEAAREGDTYRMILKREGIPAGAMPLTAKVAPKAAAGSPAVFITSDRFGRGSDELGALLMKAFINTLKEISPLPGTIIFANAGVFLTTEGSPVIESLRGLHETGVEILSCGTCLEFFNIKEKLLVGTVSNMYTIAEKLLGASNVVTP
jgi:selenium metabolism protein YedF